MKEERMMIRVWSGFVSRGEEESSGRNDWRRDMFERRLDVIVV
jgi:hypothetical protein